MIIFTFLNFAEGKRTVIYLWKWFLLHSFLSTKMQIFVYLVNEWPGKKLKDEDDFSAVMRWDSMPTLDSMNSLPAGLLCNGICPAQTNRLILFIWPRENHCTPAPSLSFLIQKLGTTIRMLPSAMRCEEICKL